MNVHPFIQLNLSCSNNHHLSYQLENKLMLTLLENFFHKNYTIAKGVIIISWYQRKIKRRSVSGFVSFSRPFFSFPFVVFYFNTSVPAVRPCSWSCQEDPAKRSKSCVIICWRMAQNSTEKLSSLFVLLNCSLQWSIINE